MSSETIEKSITGAFIKWAVVSFILNLCAVAVLQYQVVDIKKQLTDVRANHSQIMAVSVELSRRGEWMLTASKNIEGLLENGNKTNINLVRMVEIQQQFSKEQATLTKLISALEKKLSTVAMDVELIKQGRK